MKENKYDDPLFFEKYGAMERSKKGLDGAGEWWALRKILPDFKGKRVLDLGCGYGWHCIYAAEQGAASVVGIDISQKMIDVAVAKNRDGKVVYRCTPIEDVDFEAEAFDVVISSLALHYIASYDELLDKIGVWLGFGGVFVFSVEHPVFTAHGSQNWVYDQTGAITHFPVDDYFREGSRQTEFLGERVTKYHRTLTHYINGLIRRGFVVEALVEPEPEQALIDAVPEMIHELRRPMMLIVSARKA